MHGPMNIKKKVQNFSLQDVPDIEVHILGCQTRKQAFVLKRKCTVFRFEIHAK